MPKHWRIPWCYVVAGCSLFLTLSCDHKAPDPDRPMEARLPANTDAPVDPPPNTPPTVSEIQVEIQGAVNNPGAYAFPADTRLFEALQRAGGPSSSAEIRDLNIAAPLLDGSVVTVPEQHSAESPYPATAALLNPPAYTRSGWLQQEGATSPVQNGNTTPRGCVDLNRATASELESLPGVGPKTAEKIIRYREQQPFTTVEDLRNVQGIGDTRMQTLGPLICVQ